MKLIINGQEELDYAINEYGDTDVSIILGAGVYTNIPGKLTISGEGNTAIVVRPVEDDE